MGEDLRKTTFYRQPCNCSWLQKVNINKLACWIGVRRETKGEQILTHGKVNAWEQVEHVSSICIFYGWIWC